MNSQIPLPPRRSFPLYGKILLWFIANILLVGGGAFWLLREQFGLDRTLLLTRDGRARLQLRAQQTVDHLLTSGHDPVRLNELLAQGGDILGGPCFSLALLAFTGAGKVPRPSWCVSGSLC